jgi:hypothetical protein
MLRTDPSPSNRSSPPIYREKIGPSTDTRQIESTKKLPWPVAALAAGYRYLSEGVRILGKAYSTYDDRNNQ